MNILFIMSDSLVPHLTGAYGDRAGGTPNLDRLATRGTVFENAYCNSPLCAPSRASLVTGRYVSELGAFDNASEFSSEWPTVAYALASEGYETTLAGKMHFIGHDQLHGLDYRMALESDYSTGFNTQAYAIAYSWEKPPRGNPVGVDWMGPSYVNSEKWDDYPRHYDDDQTTHQAALEYLAGKRPGGSPFFCCVSYHAPHNPFWIPERFKEPFRDKELPLPSIPDGIDTCHGPMDDWLNTFHYVPEVRDAMMREDNLRWLYETYYGMVNYLDQCVGELLDALQANGLAQDTAIVLTGDHGDMLAHRGMLQKRYLYERSVRVPLIFALPGRWQEGQRVSQPVSLVDLFPTFAEMGQAPVPANLPGSSLLPTVSDGSAPEDRPVFCEYHGEGVHAPCFAVRSGDLKYIYVHGHEERLYNVAEDPDEFSNLIAQTEHTKDVSRLREELLRRFDPDSIAEKALVSQRNRGYILDCSQRGRRNNEPLPSTTKLPT